MTVRVKIPFGHYTSGEVLKDVPYPGEWMAYIARGLAEEVETCEVKQSVAVEVEQKKRRK